MFGSLCAPTLGSSGGARVGAGLWLARVLAGLWLAVVVASWAGSVVSWFGCRCSSVFLESRWSCCRLSVDGPGGDVRSVLLLLGRLALLVVQFG
jgi:hypothetical protein